MNKQNSRSGQALAAVIGSPVKHSLSPVIHNAAFATVSLPWVFATWEVPEGKATQALESMEDFGVVGLSVTMPHKMAIAEYLSSQGSERQQRKSQTLGNQPPDSQQRESRLPGKLSEDARKLGAVNCVVVEEITAAEDITDDGAIQKSAPKGAMQLTGYNTDAQGLVNSLRHDNNFDPEGKACAIFGAGGAARAAVLGLARAGAEKISVFSRTFEKSVAAAELADCAQAGSLAGEPQGVPTESLSEFDLVINATPAGMKLRNSSSDPDYTSDYALLTPEDMPFAPSLLNSNQLLVDLIYEPYETPLLRHARVAGVTATNGCGMLVHQAALAFELWTGKQAPLDAMQSAIQEAVQ